MNATTRREGFYLAVGETVHVFADDDEIWNFSTYCSWLTREQQEMAKMAKMANKGREVDLSTVPRGTQST